MAKQQMQSKGNGTSKIRFIMIEAEIPDGSLADITSAIQNALKPAAVVQQRLPVQPASANVLVSNGTTEFIEEDPLIEEYDAQDELQAKATRPAKPRNRKPPALEVVEFDFDSDRSLRSFAEEHPVKDEPERHLVIAAWAKEHRDHPAVTVHLVYTGYRKLGWPTGIEDFSWPLRALKKKQFMANPERGHYAINHLGLDRVRQLKSS